MTTEAWKTERYQELAFEVRRIQQVEVPSGAIGYRGPRNSLERLCEVAACVLDLFNNNNNNAQIKSN